MAQSMPKLHSSRPLVSVVTPVYNAQKFLRECIESVLSQTYQNWEYVIVDNCSTDGSREIAEGYVRKDARIRLHNNERFLGAIENQNHALRLISPSSKYCKVVHADDRLFPRCIEEMVTVAEASPTIGIVSAYRLADTKVSLDRFADHAPFFLGREICRRSLLGEFYVFGSPTSLLIRADFVRQREPFYQGTHPWVDVETCYELLQDCNFGFVHEVLTYSRRHAGAESYGTRKFKRNRLAQLALLTRFGPIYLSTSEYELRLRFLLARYHRFLVRSAFQGQSRSFWEFHRNGIVSIGLRLSPLKLFEAFIALAFGLMVRPFKMLFSAVQSRQG